MNGQVDVVVIGGGVSGLAAAHGALNAGASVLLLEASANVGGVMRTEMIDGFLVEHGPTSMAASESARKLLSDVGIATQIVAPRAEAKRRYVVRDGKMHPLPSSPGTLLRSRLLSTSGKIRLLAEPFVARSRQDGDESLGALVSRRFGSEVLNYLVDPFVSGVCAGDATRLSKRHTLRTLNELEREHGSVLRGAIRKTRRSNATSNHGIVSLRDGMQQLPEALNRAITDAERGEVLLNVSVTQVVRSSNSWHVHFRSDEGGGVVQAGAIVCALPSHRLSAVSWPEQWESSFSAIAGVRSAPIATVGLGFRRSDLQHELDGFGVLCPSVENSSILGALFNSSMFGGRAPPGHCLVTAFVGGARTLAAPSVEQATTAALTALTPLLGITSAPVMTHVSRWDAGIPQLEVGHERVLAAAGAISDLEHSAYLTGSYLSGVAIGDCLAHGTQAGTRAAASALRDGPVQRNILARISG